MVIQRIQSIYLLLAAIIMTVLSFAMPVARLYDPTVEIYITNLPELLVINLITALLLVVDIFLFKNLKLQMQLARISTVLIVLSAVIEAFVLFSKIEGEAKWIGSACMLAAAFLCTILALKGMQKDHKLLTSYDRLR